VKQWRCSLGWMSIHIVMTTSPIIRGLLRSRIGGKRTSTLISRNLVFDSRVCVNIFKSCLPTPMTTPEQSAAHLTRGRSQRLISSTFSREIFMSYSQLMSQMSLDPGVGTFSTQYDAPHASSYDTPCPSTRVPETQAPPDARHERPRREIRPRNTYSPSLIQRMFRRRWCIFFRLLFVSTFLDCSYIYFYIDCSYIFFSLFFISTLYQFFTLP
jgi:hypothetical protein